jgi:hypothetical protein
MDYGANGGEEMACGRAFPGPTSQRGLGWTHSTFPGVHSVPTLTYHVAFFPPAAEPVTDQPGCYRMSAVKGLGRKQR